jgi:hypothetical protein
MNDDDRLEALTRRMAATRPVLDDVTRARVASRLAEAIAAPPAPPARARRWIGVAALAGVAAAAALAVVAARAMQAPEPVVAAAGAPAAPPVVAPPAPVPPIAVGPAVTAPAPAPDPANAPRVPAAPGSSSHERAWVAPENTVTVSIGSAPTGAIVFGPGWVERRRDGLVADASGVVVDLPAGGAPIEVRFRTATIRVTSAAFGVAGTPPRVAVMRGEVVVECERTLQTVHAGEVAECPASRDAVAARAPAPAPAPPAPAVAPVAPVAVDAAPPPETARPALIDGLYARAEVHMRAGEIRAASALLEEVAAQPAAGLQGALALLDLARLAAQDGAPGRALAYLDRLGAAPSRDVVADPAAHLRCEVELALGRVSAAACLEHYLRDFPAGVRRADAQARLTAWYEARGRCADARRVASLTTPAGALRRCPVPPAR